MDEFWPELYLCVALQDEQTTDTKHFPTPQSLSQLYRNVRAGKNNGDRLACLANISVPSTIIKQSRRI